MNKELNIGPSTNKEDWHAGYAIGYSISIADIKSLMAKHGGLPEDVLNALCEKRDRIKTAAVNMKQPESLQDIVK